jgi:hypothetical protein
VDDDEEDVDENDPKAIEAAEKRLEEKAGLSMENGGLTIFVLWLIVALYPNQLRKRRE